MLYLKTPVKTQSLISINFGFIHYKNVRGGTTCTTNDCPGAPYVWGWDVWDLRRYFIPLSLPRSAPLPLDWQIYHDFFLNEHTNHIQREHPMRPVFEKILQFSKIDPRFGDPQEMLGNLHAELMLDCEELQSIWTGPYHAENGEPYYSNLDTGQSTWTNPMAATVYAAHVLESLLKMRFGRAVCVVSHDAMFPIPVLLCKWWCFLVFGEQVPVYIE